MAPSFESGNDYSPSSTADTLSQPTEGVATRQRCWSIKATARRSDSYFMPLAAIIAVAVAVFLGLSWLHWRRSGTYIAPGIGAVGGGTAMIAVGGALVAKGHESPGVLLDLFGVIAIWAAFRTYGQN